MDKILGRRTYYTVLSNDKYIASLGNSITILDRNSLRQIHHFSGIRCVHGGLFLNEDILLVYTGEQRLYFLQISSRSILWACPKPRELAMYGDPRCCMNPNTGIVVCIMRGKMSLEDHYLLLVDIHSKSIVIRKISNIYRVVLSPIWIDGVGLNFLSFQAKGDGNILYKMSSIGENGDVDTIREWEGKYIIKHYSGKYFFLEELGLSEPQMYALELRCNEDDARLVVENIYPIPLPAQQLTDALGNTKKYLPTITWVDEVGEIIVVKTLDWVGVYNFRKGKLLSECKCDNVCCALTVDEKLILGCSPGLMVEYMGQGDGLITL